MLPEDRPQLRPLEVAGARGTEGRQGVDGHGDGEGAAEGAVGLERSEDRLHLVVGWDGVLACGEGGLVSEMNAVDNLKKSETGGKAGVERGA